MSHNSLQPTDGTFEMERRVPEIASVAQPAAISSYMTLIHDFDFQTLLVLHNLQGSASGQTKSVGDSRGQTKTSPGQTKSVGYSRGILVKILCRFTKSRQGNSREADTLNERDVAQLATTHTGDLCNGASCSRDC